MSKNKPTSDEWMRIQDIQTTKTSDPKVMLNKYTACNVLRQWTDTFIDESTNEEISIERNEIILRKGTLIDKDKLQTLMFHLQAGDITSVEVTDLPINAERYVSSSYKACEVTISSDCKKKLYLLNAQTIEQAIQIATEYASVYGDLASLYSVIKVEFKPYIVVQLRYDDENKTLAQMIADLDINDPELDNKRTDRYKCTAKIGIYDDFEDKINYSTTDVIIRAEEVGQAKNRTFEYLYDKWKEELEKSEYNSLKVIKATPYEAEQVIPLSYSKLYNVPETKIF